MKFTVTIELGNDAMRSSRDIARALHGIAQKVRDGQTSGKVMDDNGNSVGQFEFVKENKS